MKMTQMVGRRLKEVPKDAKTASHQFLIRGGYIRPVSTGIYSLLPAGKKIVERIEAIIREEMNKIDGQEILMPVVLPAELWKESGRFDSVGAELLRFKDRNDKDMLLAMTHEECVTALVRSEVNSYKQLPVMLYQIQTKYRDEARPRAGLIRTREFTMKDAYSFHTDQADLEAYYVRAHEAYERIFKRLGLDNVLSIESNSGMMGGKVSHEFMLSAIAVRIPFSFPPTKATAPTVRSQLPHGNLKNLLRCRWKKSQLPDAKPSKRSLLSSESEPKTQERRYSIATEPPAN